MEDKKISYVGNVELRKLEVEGVESRTVCGYALKYDCESQDMGFIEILRKGCITEETIANSDIYARLDHYEHSVLARSRYGEGSLNLELREDGLYYEFEAPHTVAGDELLEHLRRGEINTSSFAFSLPKDGMGERWYNKNGKLYREILKIERLFDVSPVYEPAYLNTTCSKRAKEMVDLNKELTDRYDKMLEELEKI